ncbi:MAG TPA: TonB-dependent receptor [Alphaproteobacteria bacterium]|nr:TonB-dependent receptor [Alphaproteobacteria bacterium]
MSVPFYFLTQSLAHKPLARTILASSVAFAMAPPAAAQESVRLAPVVISASATPVPAGQVGSAVTVITAEQIERQQARSAAELLRQVPGVTVSQNGNAGSFTQVRIRGAESNHTLVLIDGVEMNDPSGASEFDFGNLNAFDIERMEIVRGPQSAIYGSDAIGGVINIVTKKGEGPTTGTLSLEGGSFETGRAIASLRGGAARYNYSVAASYFRTGGVSVAPEDQGNTEDDGSEHAAVNANFGFTLFENLEIDLFGRFVDSRVETDPQPAVAGTIVTVDGDEETETIQRTGKAQIKHTAFDGMWENIAAVGFNRDEADSLTDDAVTFSTLGEKTKLSYQSNLFLETPDIAGAEHTLSFLVEREYEAQETESAFGSSDLDIVNNGFVGEYRTTVWDRLSFSGSVRFDDNEIFEDATTYRITGSYLHTETGTRLHASYGTGVKNPTLFELFGFGPNFVPNPDLEPEESEGFDVGIEQRFWGDRALLDVTYFNNEITDLIAGAGNTAVNLSGVSDIQGVEVSGSVEPADGLRFSGMYTYTLGQDAAGLELVRRPKHTANLNASYRFLEDQAVINVGATYIGDRKDLQFSNFFIDSTRVTLDSYTKVDIAASYQVTEAVQVFGRVENLLDEEYEEVLGFAAPGIGAFAGVRVQLGLF